MNETVTRKLYPLEETASILGVHRTTTYKLVTLGELELVKIGRKSLITAASIDSYIERLTGVRNGAA